jgi:hypothetical protein
VRPTRAVQVTLCVQNTRSMNTCQHRCFRRSSWSLRCLAPGCRPRLARADTFGPHFPHSACRSECCTAAICWQHPPRAAAGAWCMHRYAAGVSARHRRATTRHWASTAVWCACVLILTAATLHTMGCCKLQRAAGQPRAQLRRHGNCCVHPLSMSQACLLLMQGAPCARTPQRAQLACTFAARLLLGARLMV